MKTIITAAIIAAGIAGISASSAQAGGAHGYNNELNSVCYYYKTRAMGARTQEMRDLMWVAYYECRAQRR